MLSQTGKFQKAIAIGGAIILLFISATFSILTAMAHATTAPPLANEPLPGTIITEQNWKNIGRLCPKA